MHNYVGQEVEIFRTTQFFSQLTNVMREDHKTNYGRFLRNSTRKLVYVSCIQHESLLYNFHLAHRFREADLLL